MAKVFQLKFCKIQHKNKQEAPLAKNNYIIIVIQAPTTEAMFFVGSKLLQENQKKSTQGTLMPNYN